jgi:hypothetical protein
VLHLKLLLLHGNGYYYPKLVQRKTRMEERKCVLRKKKNRNEPVSCVRSGSNVIFSNSTKFELVEHPEKLHQNSKFGL